MAAFTPDTSNEMFRLATQLVNQSARNIFLTGKAGTGKTTFLKYIRENCPKQIAVVAPTGVAAINAGGVTIHSFFQLPLSPFIPEGRGLGFSENKEEVADRHSLISRLRFNGDKKKVLQQMEILVIDEISMVRCDTLDAIDTILRHVRQRPYERFGGVQVLFIGDMLQLPPVIKDQEWNILSAYYGGPYFFDSKVLQEEPPLYIEFNKIYRQSDERFISLLNQVRNNQLDEEGLAILESRFIPLFRRKKKDGFIILTTHNNKASEINARELGNLEGRLFTYQAQIQEEFSDRAFPADELLQLKVGAQVMFIRNDTAEKGKRFFNGKIGTVSKLETDKVFVQCQASGPNKPDPEEIEVQKEKWENIRYSLNKSTRLLDSELIGSFTQYPLRLAWAITIHKSQGLTFEKAIIDVGEAFAPGQVYVALSRCTSLEGMVLQSRVRASSLFTEPSIASFSQQTASDSQLEKELAIARKNYQQSLLLSTFDFTIAISSGKEMADYLQEHESSFNTGSLEWAEQLLKQMANVQATASKFHVQLKSLFQQPGPAEENGVLQERIKAAADYFVKAIGSLINYIQQSPAVTDSRLHSKEYNEGIREIFAQLTTRKYMLEGFNGYFDPEVFHRRKQEFILPSTGVNAYAGVAQKRTETAHPALHQQLRKLRDSICSRKDLPIYIVAGTATIDEMARYLPQTLSELRMINGFGDAKVRQYGPQFLEIILEYCKENNLSSLIHEKTPKRGRRENSDEKKGKTDTKTETWQLFQEGKSVADIAKARDLTAQTIEGHLAYFLQRGDINIGQLVSPEKLLLIEPAIKEFNGGSILPVKEKLGNTISFGEIRLVLAWTKYKSSIDPE